MSENQTYNDLLSQVSDLQRKVEELELKLKTNQQKTDLLKRRFLSSVSHELRTPMNAILGFSNLMIDKNLSHDKREEYMDHINSSSSSLLSIVDSMIDVSLLEVGEICVRKESVNLHEILQQVYYYFNIDKHKMEKDNLALLLNRSVKSEKFMIYTDGYRLNQILSSLLHNALKFTTKGLIEFGYEVKESQGKIEFFVKDTGKGVLFDKAQSIFEKFEKLEEDYSTNEGGLGLGLTLARGLVKLLGGEIWLESNAFKGTTFLFTIDYTLDMSMSEQKQTLINTNEVIV
ncbi:MAG: HAMP domain-containing histidine kinase [Bacteroidales bacterium]|nr:HAMP domain-containing histidine kinase [Bacteroidales bacterium]MCF8389467.1 HAMP domain-containing histidine kinase [Bacteroidales bacterium]